MNINEQFETQPWGRNFWSSNDVLNQKWREVNAQLNLNSRIRPVLFNRGWLLVVATNNRNNFVERKYGKARTVERGERLLGVRSFEGNFRPMKFR